MHPSRIRRTPATLAAAAILAIGSFVAVAAALPPTITGGTSQLRMDNKADTAPQNTAAVGWQWLTGSEVPVTVPAGRKLLVNARFTAESGCYGPLGPYCRTRIVAVDPLGAIVELNPADGLDFHFDSAHPAPVGNSDREGHAMERSRYLDQPGTWRVRVQFSVSNPAVLFTLDDWHHAVETTAA